MRVIRNDKFIKSRASLGRTVSLAGLVILVIGLLISFSAPQLFLLSFLCLLIGFICSQVGIYLGNRYLRLDRPDEVLAKALKGFDDRYSLYQYVAPAGNVLLTPNACLVFVVKLQAGKIDYQNGKWRQQVSGLKRLFGWMTQESLGNLTRESEVEVTTLQRFLSKKLPDLTVPIQALIVFGDPRAEVNVADSPVPAIHAKKLKEWLRNRGKSGGLTTETRSQLAELLEVQDSSQKMNPTRNLKAVAVVAAAVVLMTAIVSLISRQINLSGGR
jgi:hypothetical protein